MQTRISDRSVRGFSLIELLTAVSIMVVIIFALYAMFSQTQKALRSNITQVDVLESGRSTAEMLGRDLQQLQACNLSNTLNLSVRMEPFAPMVQLDTAQNPIPLAFRTNILQEIFFLSRQTNSWVGTGYRVLGAQYGVGTLYRFTVWTNYQYLNANNLINQFLLTSPTNPATGFLRTNFNRVADGVVHLRLTAYDPEGRRMGWETTNAYPSYRLLRMNRSGAKLGLYSTATNAAQASVMLQQDAFDPSGKETRLSFLSNAVPAYLELELGVLEPVAYKQFQALADGPPQVAISFLSKQASKVQVFRQRIPIRTVQQ